MDLIRSRYEGRVCPLGQYLDSLGIIDTVQALEHEPNLEKLFDSTLVCTKDAIFEDRSHNVDVESVASMTDVLTS
jgi:hypothetical protein